ncbi:hypothetical protein KFE25_008543 [Diacronema lutheri]|uniref:Uncharacterized protein n=1 Tax=Diacronema lutheri TaxID=2081491 RepID=A0A8J6CCQ5_DIALT|nr:hypothetical protein KFE25_008543 [Diacronema lutheri]
MAALLCTVPCQLASKACSSLAYVLNETCACFRPIADMLCDCSRPFMLITVVAFCVLGTPVVMIANALQADGSGDACAASGIRTDLMIQAAIFVVHFLFIVYVHSRFPRAEPMSAVYKRFGDMFMCALSPDGQRQARARRERRAHFVYAGSIYLTCRLSVDMGEALSEGAGGEGAASALDGTAADGASMRCGDVGAGLVSGASLAVTISALYLACMPCCLGCALCCAWNSGATPDRQARLATSERQPPPAYAPCSHSVPDQSSRMGSIGLGFSSFAGSVTRPAEKASASGHGQSMV